jgi:glutaminyl-peptide cyclotransferase
VVNVSAPDRAPVLTRIAVPLVVAVIGTITTVSAQRGIPPAFAGPFKAPVHGYEIVRTYPHDTSALTQGLVYKDGFLYETTGEREKSSLRKVELATGKVVQRVPVDPTQQAEGLAEYKGAWYQLTLRNGFGRIFDGQTFAEKGRFDYGITAETAGAPTAAWAIAFHKERMIIVGPTSTMRFYDPATMKETGSLVVKDGTNEINRLDELEMIRGELWCNIYQTSRIAVINPDTGQVTKWVDLAGIAGPDGKGMQPVQPEATADWVLNGIAYDAQGDRLFVTGKNWPSIFEIKVKPQPTAGS